MEVLNRKFDKEEVQRSYKKVAWFYNLWARLTESKAARIALDLADIQNGQSILEVACGTGVLFEKIVKRNPTGRNVGMDLSPAMLHKARKRLKKYDHFQLLEANAMNLPFDNGSFDMVMNNFMLDLLPVDTFDTLLRDFYRVLKPNGIAMISTFAQGKKWNYRMWFWLAMHYPGLLTGCRPISLKKYLQKAGFLIEEDLRISQNTFPSEIIKARKNG